MRDTGTRVHHSSGQALLGVLHAAGAHDPAPVVLVGAPETDLVDPGRLFDQGARPEVAASSPPRAGMSIRMDWGPIRLRQVRSINRSPGD